MMKKRYGILFLLISVFIVTACGKNVEEPDQVSDQVSDQLPDQLNVSVDIGEHYVTSTGDPSNFYYIDGNNVLWGSGRNEYGQLGQGTQDYEFYAEKVKIAEDVIHADYSQKGFVIYLTEDHKLYGMGNAGCGALQQYEEFDWTKYTNGEQYTVTTPVLLMEDAVYACCGRDDIVCLKEDGTVWTWGTVCAGSSYVPKPEKILENAVLITGGWFNHAALLEDGTVWTWGYNEAGNCGVADLATVTEPTMAAEDVTMVWTDLAVANYPEPDAEDIAMAWTGDLKYNTEYDNIAEFDEIYPKFLNNTVIRKTDGSYWVCGENAGNEEKVVVGAEGDYSVICTHEFVPVAEAAAGSETDAEASEEEKAVSYFVSYQGELFESSYAAAGIGETLDSFAWIAFREGEVIAEDLPAEENAYIAESAEVIEGSGEAGDNVWIRCVQEAFEPEEGSLGQTAHKDYIFYRQGNDVCVGVQSVEDNGLWTILKMPDYGDWLEKEIKIQIRMTTGL